MDGATAQLGDEVHPIDELKTMAPEIDIAMVRVARPFRSEGPDGAFRDLKNYFWFGTTSDLFDREVILYGYGKNDSSTGGLVPYGTLHKGHFTVDNVSGAPAGLRIQGLANASGFIPKQTSGDSGGPLFVYQGNRRFVVGTLSKVIGSPTDVVSSELFRSWAEQVIGRSCFNGVCERQAPYLETSYSCPADCNVCGDRVCAVPEDNASCPQDCGPPRAEGDLCKPGSFRCNWGSSFVCGNDGWRSSLDRACAGNGCNPNSGQCNECDSNGSSCGDNRYCDATSCSSFGLCRPRPSSTSTTFDPQCGCDGVAYWNRQHARYLGKSAFKGDGAGTCTKPVRCDSNYQCDANQSCILTYAHSFGCTGTPSTQCMAKPEGLTESDCAGQPTHVDGDADCNGVCTSSCESFRNNVRYLTEPCGG